MLFASRYRLDSLLGQGGMGQVHAGFDTLLQRKVAIKTLHETSELDAQARARFKREALAAAALDHPFICKVYEVGEQNGKSFIVMEFIEGRTLDAVMADRTLTPRELLDLASEIAQALDEAHRHGIVHRDLKPSNIMRDIHGHVKVLDFGLAKQTGEGGSDNAATRRTPVAGDTRPGTRLGTPSYMSPEQVLGSSLDARSDVFSLGVVLHQLASGQHPFLKDTPADTMAAILRDRPRSTEGDLDILPGFGHLVHRMLAKACAERFQTMRDVRSALESIRDSGAGGGSPRSGASVSPTLPQERTPLVARDAELAELSAHLDRMLLGQGSLVLLGGEPGVGKTRLAREVQRLARERGCFTAIGQCYEQEGAPPYGPFIETMSHALRVVPQAVRSSLGDVASEMTLMVPELRRAFPDIPPLPELAPEQKRRVLFDAYLTYVQRASSKSAAVVLFDDLHWADDASVQLLMHLASHLSSLRLLVIGTYRDVDLNVKRPFAKALETLLRQRLATRISIKRLNPSGVTALLTTMSGAPPPESFSRVVYDETEGNPFFVEEVFQHLREEGRLFDEQGKWKSDLRVADIDVPEGVKLVVSRRVERLGEDARKVLTAAAVIGRSFPLDILEAVAGDSGDQVLDIVEEAERAQLLQAERGREARYSFVHELIRTTLLGDLSLPRRQRLHVRAADAIETRRANAIDGHIASLAHHLYQAGAAVDQQRAIAAMVRAMLAARATGAFEQTLAFVEQLSSSDFTLDASTRLLVDEASVAALLALGRVRESLAAAERFLSRAQECGGPDQIAMAARGVVGLAGWLGRADQVAPAVQRALSRIPPDAHRARLEGLFAYGGLLAINGQLEEASTTLAEARSLAERSGNPFALGVAFSLAAVHEFSTGLPNASLASAERAIELLRESRLASLGQAVVQKAAMLVACGRLVEFDEFLSNGETLAKRGGSAIGQWSLQFWRLWVDFVRTGNLDACGQASAELAALDLPALLAGIVDHTRACVHLYQSATDVAIAQLRNRPWEQGYRASGVLGAANEIAALAWSGRAAEARAVWETISSTVRAAAPGVAHWRGVTALIPSATALPLIGEDAECAALYSALERLPAAGWVSPWTIVGPASPMLSLAVSAQAGGLPDRAREHFEEALRLANTVPDRLLQPTVKMWYGRFLATQSADDRLRGVRLLEDAAADFTSLGMPLHRARAMQWRTSSS